MRFQRSVLFVIALAVTELQAGSLDDKSGLLCQRIEQCAWTRLDADNMPEDSQQQLKASLNAVCDSIRKDMAPARSRHFEQSAEACIDSMLAQSCDELVTTSSPTQACQQLAEEQANR